MDVNIDPDEVDESTGPHRPARAVRHRLVEILGRHAGLVEDPDAVVQERDQDPVDDEPGCVVAVDRLLAGALGPLVGGAHRLVRAPRRPHDLDQRQQRRGVEEVHADDALRPFGRLGDLADRER